MPKKKSPRNQPKARVLSSKTVFRGAVFNVVSERVREPGGIIARRDVVRHAGSVVILAIDDSRGELRILLEKQYRHAAHGELWELPAGRINPGEAELAAARRELREETGFTASRWKRVERFYPSPGFLDETMSIYVARGLTRGPAQPEEDERIATRFFFLRELERQALAGRLRDAKTLIGVLWMASASSK
jgi:ADP-ribose pyrophosphatase